MMPKRRRLDTGQLLNVVHLGGVNRLGLARIVAALEAEDSSVNRIRAKLDNANHAMFANLRREEELRMTSGRPWRWDLADPGELLSLVVNESESLQALYAEAWARAPSSVDRPWSAVIGFDEFVPGNKLACDHTRKRMVLSFSFLELGGSALFRNSTWVIHVVVRANVIKKVSISNSNVFGLVFRVLSVPSLLARATLSLQFPGSTPSLLPTGANPSL